MLWLRRVLLALALLIAAAGVSAWILLRASLPVLDGTEKVAGLTGAVTLERDAAGNATISAANDDDLAFGLGYAHGQDRFFQMDAARRLASGELATLFGKVLLGQDRKTRMFRMRARVREYLKAAPAEDRRWLESYALGVNAGLDSLGSRPFEYWLLRARPLPWRAEDSLLVPLSMAWQLQASEIGDEKFRLALAAALEKPEAGDAARARAEAITALLLPRPLEWDAPNVAIQGDAAGAADDELPQLPMPEQLDLRTTHTLTATTASLLADAADFPGSNNWGLAGRRTATGAALIANDMHLGLGVPPVWYRVRLRVAGQHELVGVSLPGVPTVVAGSNGDIAWGFTNSYGDWIDLRRVSCSLEKNQWQSVDGPQSFATHAETLAVKGGVAEDYPVRETADAVLLESDAQRGECTLASWVALQPGAINLNIRAMLRARTVAEAVALAPQVSIPQQNMVVGDRDGHVAWTIVGPTPQGPHPAIVDPESGAVWSANARAATGEAERTIGGDEWQWGAGYDLGARARQIRDDLAALTTPATPADMLRIQLDDRAHYLARWRGVLLATLDDDAVRNQPARAELRALVETWDAHAGVESVGYRLLRTFQRRLSQATWQMVLAALNMDAEQYRMPKRFDASVWRLVNEQPAHLLAGNFADWRGFVLAQVDAALTDLGPVCPKLARCRWGDSNNSGVRHALSPALPFLGRWLDMPNRAVAGDHDMPRVQAPGFGASERFAVSPGHEADGYLQLPGGQSGHPLSAYYRSGFEDWAEGKPTPFLPGPTQHKLTLSPGAR